jgi:hypothetical protein
MVKWCHALGTRYLLVGEAWAGLILHRPSVFGSRSKASRISGLLRPISKPMAGDRRSKEANRTGRAIDGAGN